MVRIVIAGILGAVVYFVWGMAVWFYLDLHKGTIKELPNETAITTALNNPDMKTGVYVAPLTEDMEDTQNEDSPFYKKHVKGPIYSIYYQEEGEKPMSTKRLIGGFVIDLIGALLVAGLLFCAACGYCKKYTQRVVFVTTMGVFVALIGHASYWNWMHFPLNYTIMFMIDVSAGWLLAGLIMAAIVRCPKK